MKNKTPGFWIGLVAVVGATFVFWASYSFSQTPPSKLTRQEIARPNSLRANQPIAIPGAIKQTALQNGDAPDGNVFPAAPVQPAPPAIPVQLAAIPGVDPQNPERTGTTYDVFPAAAPPAGYDMSAAFAGQTPPTSTPISTSPLSNAEPFARQQLEASVPSNALSMEPVQQPMHTAAISRVVSAQPANEGTGSPGASILEGLQTPHLALQKVMPEEVVIDRPATLKTVIENVGNAVARNVTITDRVPQGTRLISTIPEAALSPDGELRWSVGNLDPKVQLVIEMKVLPLREGEIGSVASVNYTGEASGRIGVTRPMLKVDVKAPAEVKLGETAQVEITISNPGTATATNIVLVEKVPEGLYHRDGTVLENRAITALKPKEFKKLVLSLTCTGAGNLVNHVVVSADGNLMVEDKTTIRASAPVLNLEIAGAQKRFLERKSDYRLIVANKGNAPAHNVMLELTLPAAVQFVSTNQNGVYEASSHSVHWALEELPPQEAGEIELILMPMQRGEHSLRFTGTGENNLRAESTLPVNIDGIPAVTFEIVGDSSMVELGKEAAYEVRVTNRGTKAAENVKVRAMLAEGMSFVKAQGARYQENGGTIQFETIPQLAPKHESVYKFSARCQVEGDHRVTVHVMSDDLSSPIAKEESTRVFK